MMIVGYSGTWPPCAAYTDWNRYHQSSAQRFEPSVIAGRPHEQLKGRIPQRDENSLEAWCASFSVCGMHRLQRYAATLDVVRSLRRPLPGLCGLS